MSDIPAFPYDILWGERMVRSVANLTRKDGEDFFRLIETIPLRTTTETFRLDDAELALQALREGRLKGAAVLRVTSTPSNP
jgi:propanol-preferring alcohol dehydrogenase